MKKRILPIALILFVLITLFPAHASATQSQSDVIVFDNGDYLEIAIEYVPVRATNTRIGNKYFTYYDSNDNVEWEAKLNANFSYDGTTSVCTNASCTVTVYDSVWYEISNTTTRSGGTATTALTMGRKFLGITISKPEYTITLSCDKNGNLS